MTAVEGFDIEKVALIYAECLKDKDDILIEAYLRVYEEINKFFLLMGSVFSFVSSDVRAKIDRLKELCQQQDKRVQYLSIKAMLAHEKTEGLLNDSNFVSGSRTLLRLHRGLEFVNEFLHSLAKLQESDKTHACCKNAYDSTLGKHHSWIVRKGAHVAMYALPTQGELLKRVCTDVPRALEMLPQMLDKAKLVYSRTHKLYELYDLHGLP